MSKFCGLKQQACIIVLKSFVFRWTVFLGSFMCLWSDLGQAGCMLVWLTLSPMWAEWLAVVQAGVGSVPRFPLLGLCPPAG